MSTSQPHNQSRQKALQEELRELVDVVGPAPLVDLLLERAFQIQATDIHLDPTDDGLRVRLRVDGLLHDVLQLPKTMTSHVISRLKLMANMDITEKRYAQDGHISNAVIKHQRDVRAGSGPTIYGERMVLRLMPDASRYRRLEEFGLEKEQQDAIKKCISAPYGMILSVGPVGSGKSTTMYACLEILNDPAKSCVTIEDPVERRVNGVNQIQVEPKISFGFVEALRGVLRQDPNVIMIGEIRDPETAHIGVRAGLTGVIVLSTMHANDTASTVDVFREFSVPPMFIADSVQGIVTQRLIRIVCKNCRTDYHPDEAMCQYLGIDPGTAQSVNLARGTGCDQCFHTGYLGRTGIFEVMTIDGPIREAILHQKSHDELMEVARRTGMMTLEEAAKKKVRDGVTTIEEVHRVLTAF
ncbi:MAG: GspE/PulE family protein [Planctomycetaceae bacterium]